MKANTALALARAGASLWLLAARPGEPWVRRLAQAGGLAVVTTGALTLLEYLAGWDLGIDRLLAVDRGPGAFPGRMGANTASALLLLGLALVVLPIETARGWRPAQALGLVGGAIGIVALVGYLYSATALYGIASYTQMALPTAAAIVLLALGILFARPDRGIMATVTSDGPGGLTARRLLPAALLVRLALGWLRLEGQRAGFYGTHLRASLLVTVTMALFAGLTVDERGVARPGRRRAPGERGELPAPLLR